MELIKKIRAALENKDFDLACELITEYNTTATIGQYIAKARGEQTVWLFNGLDQPIMRIF